ncbi:MAG: hypothetical protein M1838_001388, partial [Thelocarpon superellum]
MWSKTQEAWVGLKTSLQTQVTSCVEKACSPSDQKAIAQTVSDTCAKIGVPISISATAPGSTSSVASSTTVASSTASVAPEAPPLEPSPASLPSTPPASAAAVIAPTTHRVDVGAAGQPTFQPNQLNAAVGDVVIFNFLGTNDTLTQSSFSNPCVGSGGFNTDFHHYNPQSLNNMFMVTYRVDSSDPQWFFCAQTVTQSHCRAGMVFAINPGEQMDTFMNDTGADTHHTLHIAADGHGAGIVLALSIAADGHGAGIVLALSIAADGHGADIQLL